MIMKASLIVIALLSGWLIAELKDFVLNGGFDNKLATILLKIIFIMNGILICALCDFNLQRFFPSFERLRNSYDTPGPIPRTNNSNTSRRSVSRSRNNRFGSFFVNSD